MHPIAVCDDEGKLVWHKKWIDLCYTYSIKLKQKETFHTHRSDCDDGHAAPLHRSPAPPPTHQQVKACYERSFVKPKPKRRIECDDE